MSNWHSIELGEVLTITSGGTPNRKVNEYYQDGTIGWVKTGELKVKYIHNSKEKITELGLTNSSAKLFPPNTVLIAMYGASIGSTSILKKELTTNQACGALLPSDQVYPEYLYYYLKKIKPELISRGVGGAQPNISGTILKQTKIPLPPLHIQKKIAEVLDKADELRQIKKKAIEKLDQLIQSIFLDMFGDPVTNPKGWEKVILGECINKIQAGKSLVGETRPQKGSELGVLKVSAVTSGIFRSKENKVITNTIDRKTLIFPRKGDLLISRANTRELVLASCIVDEDYNTVFLPDKLWNIISDEKRLTRLYLKYVLTQPKFRYEITKMATGTSGSMLNISQEKFKNTILPVPPVSIQIAFAKKIESLNSLRVMHNNNLLFINNLFNSLMQRAFKGELQFKD